MSKLNFEEVIDRISDGGFVHHSAVLASALNRKVWVAEWHLPGCLSESQCYCTSKAQAISAALSMAEGEDGPPYGMRAALLRDGMFVSQSPLYGTCINTVSQSFLSELL